MCSTGQHNGRFFRKNFTLLSILVHNLSKSVCEGTLPLFQSFYHPNPPYMWRMNTRDSPKGLLCIKCTEIFYFYFLFFEKLVEIDDHHLYSISSF